MTLPKSEKAVFGNVGIGTASPTQKLQVEGNIRLLNSCGYIQKVKGLYFGWSSSYGTQFNHGIFSTDGTAYSDDITINSYGNVRINFDSNTNGGIEKFSIGRNTTGLANTLFTVNESGNVGIGTESPSYKLHAKGDIYANGGWLRVSGARGLYFQSYGGGFYMTDATWIRTYNNKSFYHNSGIMRTDGTFQVGLSGNRFIVNSSGNVGIGTTSPSEKLHVNGRIYATSGIKFGDGSVQTSANSGGLSVWTQSGASIYYNVTDKKVGIGTSNPSTSLEIRYGVLKLSGNASSGQFLTTDYARLTIDTEYSTGHPFISCMNNTGVKFFVHADGTVKCYKVMTEEVIVENITLPDYVFEENYALRSLNEVEEFINKNSRLPDVPSAKQVAEEGMNLKEMNNILLQKVEELTLYIIQMENRISEIENK